MTERQYKDSGIDWIGEIPNRWKTTRIKFIGETKSGDEIRKESILDHGEYPVYGGGKKIGFCNDYNTNSNDILIGRVGSCGKINLPKQKAWATDNAIILRAKSNFNYKFLAYCLKCVPLEIMITQTAQPLLTATSILNCNVPRISLQEQQQIADFLDSTTASIDSAIQAQKNIVEKLKEYRQAVITEAVTKGLNPDAEMKDSKTNGVDKIPATWEDMKIKYLGLFCNGLTYHPEDICGEDEGTLVLRSSNIQDGKLNFNDNVYVKCSIPTKIRVKKGDIIICSRNGSAKLIGKNALVTNDMNATFGAFMMMFRCDSPRYMYYVLNSKTWETYLALFATTTINQLTSTAFGNLLFPYTFDKEEQCRIVEYLDSKTATIDKAIEQKNAIIEKLEEYKKSIIYSAVTGKIDCRKDVIPE